MVPDPQGPETLLRVAVLASGSGSNLQAIIDRCAAGAIPAQVVLVMSNNSGAFALERARQAGIAAVHWSGKKAGSPEAFVDGLLAMLRQAQVDLIVLAGYMKLVPPAIIEAYAGRILNIHPALLPKFGGSGLYGIHVHEAVLAAREAESGATVHLVDAQYDHGAILLQRRVPVHPDDTPETLRDRVLAIEHEILPEAIGRFAREHGRMRR
jgi:phosphoribosylglycinamide formyltransferase-1